MRIIFTVMWLSLLVTNVNASNGPCPFTALIDQGETLIMCPESSEFLSTGPSFDSYQWYRQSALTLETELIAGETNNIIEISALSATYFFYWCEVSLDGCTDISNLIFIDSYVFVPTTVQTETTSICEGESTVFQIIGTVGSYEWYRDGSPLGIDSPTLEVAQAGTYTASVFPVLCPGLEINSGVGTELVVHPTPMPVIFFNDVSNEVCLEASASSIEWFYENSPIIGANTMCIDLVGDGNYIATVLDEFGCRGESDVLMVTNVHEAYSHVQVFPNPCVNAVNIQVENPQLVRLVDVCGQEIKSENIDYSSHWDVSNLTSGIYFLLIGDRSFKLIKVH
ncbi:MAG: T9SS type A sorting domain-containing protein [Cryomorphaceae bacterium]|nr:T9SS type A sorting domain-containing protein [Cryomorphaceae bacterium]